MKQTVIFLIALACTGLTPAYADGGGGAKRESPLKPYLEMIDAGEYERAIRELDQALSDDPENADMLNLVAYSHRQLERYEIALNYYQKALQLDPDHRGALEYLGELYLYLGELEQAERQLAILDKECFFGCREFDKLEEAIEEYRKNNPS